MIMKIVDIVLDIPYRLKAMMQASIICAKCGLDEMANDPLWYTKYDNEGRKINNYSAQNFYQERIKCLRNMDSKLTKH